jgi:tRNA 2-thiouridine synthesizing protein B
MSTILHIVNQSPFASTVIKQCLERLHHDDAIILLEDGIYCAMQQQPFAQQIQALPQCYAIKKDVQARGINADQLLSKISLIDYAEFVALTIRFPLNQSWY